MVFEVLRELLDHARGVDVFGQVQVVHPGGMRSRGNPRVQEVGQARDDRVDVREQLLEGSGVADIHDGRALTGHPALVGVDFPHLESALDEHVGDQPPDVAKADDCDPVCGWRVATPCLAS